VISDTHLPRGARRLPEECLRRLAGADLILHAGDHASLASLEELRALGPRVERVARFPPCAAVVYGHSHLPQVERHAGVWILNPGSPTERRRAPSRTMLELRIEAGSIEPSLIVLPA